MGYHFFSMVQQPLGGQDFLIIKTTRSHSVRHTTLGRLLWTTDQHHTNFSLTTLTRTGVHDAAGFEHETPASERQQTHPWKAWPLRSTVAIYVWCLISLHGTRIILKAELQYDRNSFVLQNVTT